MRAQERRSVKKPALCYDYLYRMDRVLLLFFPVFFAAAGSATTGGIIVTDRI